MNKLETSEKTIEVAKQCIELCEKEGLNVTETRDLPSALSVLITRQIKELHKTPFKVQEY